MEKTLIGLFHLVPVTGTVACHQQVFSGVTLNKWLRSGDNDGPIDGAMLGGVGVRDTHFGKAIKVATNVRMRAMVNLRTK